MIGSDLVDLSRLVRLLGWNQTDSDLRLLLEPEDAVNLVAIQNDRVVGTVASINYQNRVCWIGMMIVDAAYRGQGIGGLLMRSIIQELQKIDGIAIKLDATPKGRPVYRKLGFEDESTIYRMVCSQFPGRISTAKDPGVSAINHNNLPQIINLDQAVFGVRRTQLLSYLATTFPDKGHLLEEGGRIAAFALGRLGRQYHHIGPAIGSSPDTVIRLLQTVLEKLPQKAIVMDVCSHQTKILKWLEAQGFQCQRPLYRMYLRHNPYPGDGQRQYLIGGPEFG